MPLPSSFWVETESKYNKMTDKKETDKGAGQSERNEKT